MEDFRSRSYADGRMQMEVYSSRTAPPYGLHDFRSYSASYASWPPSQQPQATRETKFQEGKGAASGSSSAKGGWGFKDPELQRKTRVAGYKLYAVEGRMKGSLRKSFRWLKNRYTQVLYGWS